jgi:hypothetical protein
MANTSFPTNHSHCCNIIPLRPLPRPTHRVLHLRCSLPLRLFRNHNPLPLSPPPSLLSLPVSTGAVSRPLSGAIPPVNASSFRPPLIPERSFSHGSLLCTILVLRMTMPSVSRFSALIATFRSLGAGGNMARQAPVPFSPAKEDPVPPKTEVKLFTLNSRVTNQMLCSKHSSFIRRNIGSFCAFFTSFMGELYAIYTITCER